MNTDKKISRREALKRMGFAVMSGAIASSGLLSLASCETKRSKRIIFYFTGTGNSLYIARQLAGENAELLSIPQMVKRGKYEFEADEIGIVYPIYGHMPPYMVRQFILACIQNCPQKAIQFIKQEDGSFPDGTEKNPNARYRNEHISLIDLKRANNQKL